MEPCGGPDLPADTITFATASTPAHGSSSTGKRAPPLPAAHEVRQLRAQVQRLERRLAELCASWRAALLPADGSAGSAGPQDARVLLAACAAAREKARTARVERQNGVLRDQLMQQQLFYASLQDQLARRAPLGDGASRAAALFASLHAPLRLSKRRVEDADGGERSRQLRHRLDRGLQDGEDVMDAFTRELLPLASTYLPFSSTSVAPTTIRGPSSSSSGTALRTRGAPGTLVSNVFVCKLPAESDVAHVFRLVVDNLKRSPAELSQRLGIHLDFSMLDVLGPDKYYGQVTRGDGSFKGVATSTAFAAELLHSDLGVALMDFADEDDELAGGPLGSSASHVVGGGGGGGGGGSGGSSSGSDAGGEPPLGIDTCSLVTVSRMKAEDGAGDEGDERRRPVLLRRLRVHRYNLPPHSPTLHRDLELHLPFLNGDLPMEMLSAAVAREGVAGSWAGTSLAGGSTGASTGTGAGAEAPLKAEKETR